MTNEWKKHDGTKGCPVPLTTLIEVETYSSAGNYKAQAKNLEWEYVKFYKEIPSKK